MRVHALAAQCARAVDESLAQRGRGERRMPVAPAASRALGSGRTHTSNNECVGWVEPLRNPSCQQNAIDGYRFAQPILRARPHHLGREPINTDPRSGRQRRLKPGVGRGASVEIYRL